DCGQMISPNRTFFSPIQSLRGIAMIGNPQPGRTHPAKWVPPLYFAEGLPFYAVALIALTFYQRVGVSNQVIALTTSLLAFPWTLKPLWSPFLEMYKTKKFFVVL